MTWQNDWWKNDWWKNDLTKWPDKMTCQNDLTKWLDKMIWQNDFWQNDLTKWLDKMTWQNDDKMTTKWLDKLTWQNDLTKWLDKMTLDKMTCCHFYIKMVKQCWPSFEGKILEITILQNMKIFKIYFILIISSPFLLLGKTDEERKDLIRCQC